MKAAYIEQTGPPETIIYGDLPKPSPVGAEVLVKVRAVSVNPVDTYIRNGAKYWELPKPFIVGCDLAGIIEEVGPQVKHFRVGERVWCTNQGLMGRQGTFAEYCVVDEQLGESDSGGDDGRSGRCLRTGWRDGSSRFVPRRQAEERGDRLRARRHRGSRFDGGPDGQSRGRAGNHDRRQ